MQIPFIYSFIHYFKVFRRYTGRKLYVLTAAIIAGGLSEGIGITLLIPLFSISMDTETKRDRISETIHRCMDLLHIPFKFEYILLLILVIFFMKAAILLCQHALSAYIRASLTRDLQSRMLSSYIEMSYTYYLDSNVGYLNNIITKEIGRAVGAFGHYCLCLVGIVYIIIYASATVTINWRIAVIALSAGFVVVFSLRFLHRLSRRYSEMTSKKNASLQEFMIQTIHFFKYLKATNSFSKIKEKTNREINSLASYEFKLGVISGGLISLTEPFVVIFIVGLIYLQVSVLNKNIAEVMVVVLLFYRLVSRIMTLQREWQGFNVLTGGINTVVDAFGEINSCREPTGAKRTEKLSDGIRLEHVNFSFGDNQVLFDINITIPQNESVAIVGESGSGKSTVVDLIVGILRPDSGNIFFDNISLVELDQKNLRSRIGYVTQENVVFHDTIENNISLWETGNNTEYQRIENSARDAFCEKFIKETELGYKTVIGDRGIRLSGGQRQRLSIARELFKKPEIVVFDEATSALDSESEQFIQRSIESLKGDKTVIIIAHRLSTIKNCDYVYLMNMGRIIEEGTFDELYNRDTEFKKMCLAQQL
jgi:subfamily B ATP-binding cassette protein MsbA